MKIIFRQNREACEGTLYSNNIKSLYLKELDYKSDYKKMTRKNHFHTEYEIHMVIAGSQSYTVGEKSYSVCEKSFIIIPPGVGHCLTFASENLQKYALTFVCDSLPLKAPVSGRLIGAVSDNMDFVLSEQKKKLLASSFLIENRIFETLILLLRECGLKESKEKAPVSTESERLELAKSFIADNIKEPITLSDVASYCHISPRQLSRIFIDGEGLPPAKYINREKMIKIGELLKTSELSLSELSRLFSFGNEYYFNTAFKKHFGVPPSTYRKMFR